MRVLVTGAPGFLGSRVARQLHSRGHDVVALVRATSDRRRLADVPHEVVVGDVTDAASVARAVDGVDAVIHAAADARMGGDLALLHAVNVDGTRHVLDAASRSGATVVHVSSVTALGPTGPEPRDEHHWSDAAPVSGYQQTKREAHLLARGARDAGTDVRIAAPGGVYGPGDGSPLGRLIRVYLTLPVPVVAFRDAVQSTVHVDDCADGLVRILERGAPGDEHVLAAETVTMREWIDAMREAGGLAPPRVYVADATVARLAGHGARALAALGGPDRTVREYVDTAVRNWAYTGERARRELGWSPRPLEEGLREVAETMPTDLLGRLRSL